MLKQETLPVSLESVLRKRYISAQETPGKQGCGRCLKNGLREADYLARYGGEEFAIILPESNIESAFLVEERLRERIKSQNIVYKGKTISLTMSFGVACMPSNQDLSSDRLIKMADDALYKAKAQGRNRCCMLDRGGNECS